MHVQTKLNGKLKRKNLGRAMTAYCQNFASDSLRNFCSQHLKFFIIQELTTIIFTASITFPTASPSKGQHMEKDRMKNPSLKICLDPESSLESTFGCPIRLAFKE